jgi:hypothetical protein
LTGLKSKIAQQVDAEKKKIWADLGNRRVSFEKKFTDATSNQQQGIVLRLLAAISFGIGGIYISAWLFLGTIYFGFQFLSGMSEGIRIGNRQFSVFASLAEIIKYAHEFAQESCKTDEANLSKYFSILANISELLMRSSDFDDSEEQVARRLTAAFFLMGYTPYQYDRENRILVFTVADEKIIVRFRHRSGSATNISFVEKLSETMKWKGANRGFLFCSPGLSGNAANYANSHSIKWYTLETMNQWIGQVFYSDYKGSAENILANLIHLDSFLSKISLELAAQSSRKYSRRYRRW